MASTIMNPTQMPPNRDLVVFSLSLLGGESRRHHTEDITLKCFELFPSSFSWTKHTQYPDKDVVRVALTDARKKRYGSLVEGRVGRGSEPDGWVLTPAGIEWARANRARFEALVPSRHFKEHRQKVLGQLKRVKQHNLFVAYTEDPVVFVPPIGELAELFRCRVDAEPGVWEKRFEDIRRRAQTTEQSDVMDFVERCRKAYENQR